MILIHSFHSFVKSALLPDNYTVYTWKSASRRTGAGWFCDLEDAFLVKIVECTNLFLLVHQHHRFSDQDSA